MELVRMESVFPQAKEGEKMWGEKSGQICKVSYRAPGYRYVSVCIGMYRYLHH